MKRKTAAPPVKSLTRAEIQGLRSAIRELTKRRANDDVKALAGDLQNLAFHANRLGQSLREVVLATNGLKDLPLQSIADILAMVQKFEEIGETAASLLAQSSDINERARTVRARYS